MRPSSGKPAARPGSVFHCVLQCSSVFFGVTLLLSPLEDRERRRGGSTCVMDHQMPCQIPCLRSYRSTEKECSNSDDETAVLGNSPPHSGIRVRLRSFLQLLSRPFLSKPPPLDAFYKQQTPRLGQLISPAPPPPPPPPPPRQLELRDSKTEELSSPSIFVTHACVKGKHKGHTQVRTNTGIVSPPFASTG